MARFTAQVSEWTAKTKGALVDIFRESSARVYEQMVRPQEGGGNIPVDSGYLRASARASLHAMPRILKSKEGKEGQFYSPSGQVEPVIATAELGKKLYIGFQAVYALRANYGHKGQQGHLFVEQAAVQWKDIVKLTETEIALRFGVK